jgi:hypothetical protein
LPLEYENGELFEFNFEQGTDARISEEDCQDIQNMLNGD